MCGELFGIGVHVMLVSANWGRSVNELTLRPVPERHLRRRLEFPGNVSSGPANPAQPISVSIHGPLWGPEPAVNRRFGSAEGGEGDEGEVEAGEERVEDGKGQADHVAHTPVDALDEGRGRALHGVRAGLAERLAGGDVPLHP